MSGLLIWAAHFFALYMVASLFPGAALANGLAFAVTVVSLAVAGWLLWVTTRPVEAEPNDVLKRWITTLAAAGNALAFVAIVYQTVPTVLL
ncbi:MAG TPA: hypothetical protein VFO69_05480 [Allosphingosinicella sp.]|nr:hypothetical protein [Allosphingosinicella sp.]